MEIVDEEIAARSFPFALVKLCTLKNAQMVLMFTIHSGPGLLDDQCTVGQV